MDKLLLRNMLYVPAYKDDFIKKSLTSHADAVIYDLEDAVPPAYKMQARNLLKSYIDKGFFKNICVFIRLNSIDSGMLAEDLKYVVHQDITGFIPTKIHDNDDIAYYDTLLTNLEKENHIKEGFFKLAPLIETTMAIIKLYDIATQSNRTVALCFGGEDFLNDLGGVHGEPPIAFQYPRAAIAIAAHAAGIQAIDTPFLAVHDAHNFLQEETLSYELGFNGIQILSPAQIEMANKCFTPTPNEVSKSKEIIDAWKTSVENGSSVAMWNGKMIGPPMRKHAEQILDIMNLIKEKEGNV